MKTKTMLAAAATLIFAMIACNDSGYKKMKSGLPYKIISGGSKDSVIKTGNIVKFHFIRKLNDSVLYTSFDKMPSYIPMQEDPSLSYSPVEVFFLARKGDSIETVEMVDTLLKKGAAAQIPPNAKNGDRMLTYIKILEVFRHDSLARPDYEAEMLKDKPRQEKEMKESQEKQAAAMKEQMKKEYEELQKSGELEKQNKEIEAYLAGKKISAQKASGGTYVHVKQKGDGPPVTDGKYITVRYTGKFLPSDSVFESNVYMFEVGLGNAIQGWHDGLKLFNKGGTGTLFVPGYLAYGSQPGPGGKKYETLIFDVEVWGLSDTKEQAMKIKEKLILF